MTRTTTTREGTPRSTRTPRSAKTDRHAGASTRRIRVGTVLEPRTLRTVDGAVATVPDPDPALLTHLQFRRFAGCPVCNLHLRAMARRHTEIEAGGVREVVFFHAPDEDLRRYTPELPFALVGDPEKLTYREFGVEASRRALLDPRAWPTILRAVAVTLLGASRGRVPSPPPLSEAPRGGRIGLPADFLIAPDGTVLAAKYGEHAGDQWSVDELLELAARSRRQRGSRV